MMDYKLGLLRERENNRLEREYQKAWREGLERNDPRDEGIFLGLVLEQITQEVSESGESKSKNRSR